ncbi:MAG: hypothetical protein IJX90_04390 [Blautia sp.]|nr:hypothetical protein [Blautia sp.]
MSKTIVAVNAGPRKGWNTDRLIIEAAKKQRHETVFPEEMKTAYEMGLNLCE